jgi:hypothetical protein
MVVSLFMELTISHSEIFKADPSDRQSCTRMKRHRAYFLYVHTILTPQQVKLSMSLFLISHRAVKGYVEVEG